MTKHPCLCHQGMREQGSTRATLISLLYLASAQGQDNQHHLFNLPSKTLCISTDILFVSWHPRFQIWQRS
ncbi:hypothetical protein FGO68_gene15000 [Halteria grandinella]|uniref:Uncharacterized protein n=1 Tax=Halteria grandinella TaxID=5974 RepID=A0A8J8N9X4_HALGN|nr:hypothetical protein FGO68_gene15000 [Halteria grandinella]